MHNLSRRDFLKASALASASLFIPNFLKALTPRRLTNGSGKALVVVQLSGGCDGLNAFIPYQDDRYYRARPSIGIAATEVLRLTDQLGLHPQLAPLQELYNQGYLSIISSVGYPNPDRSHFRSMDIWQSASSADAYLQTGWIGRYLDSNCEACKLPYAAIEMDDTLSLALKGEHSSGFGVDNPNKLVQTLRGGLAQQLLQAEAAQTGPAPSELNYLYKTMAGAVESAQVVAAHAKANHYNQVQYPKGQFANHLKLIASLILAELQTQVYYVSLPGFDTHVFQPVRQQKLFEELGGGLAAFVQDLQQHNRLQDVTVMVFSEFGRRLQENGSRGTDHGAANYVWLLGGSLASPGLVRGMPNLGLLDHGDVAYQVDFRQVYATLLHDWLATDDAAILGSKFERLALVK